MGLIKRYYSMTENVNCVYKLAVLLGVLFFCFFHSSSIFAQDKIIPIKSIFASALNYNKTELAVASDKYIYLIDTKKFSLIDSIPLKARVGFQIAEISYPRPNRLIIKYGETNIYSPDIIMPRVPFQEFLQDSLFVIDISKKSIVSSLPGNVQVKANADSIIVVSENNYFQYTDDYGYSHLGSSAGRLALFSGKLQISAAANGIVDHIAIAPDGKSCIIGYYDSKKYTLEKRNLIDFSVIDTIVFEQNMDDVEILFSDDSAYFVFATYNRLAVSRELKQLRYFNSESFKQLTALPSGSNISGLIENETVWKLQENSVVQTELSTNRVLTEIWGGMALVDHLHSFYKINDDELIILGKNSEFKNKPGGVCTFSLQQNAIYTNFSKTSSAIDTLLFFDPTSTILHDNLMIEGGTKFNFDQSIMLIVGESKNHLQLWDTKTRMKIYDWYFDANVIAYLSNSGKELLVFKEFKGKNFDDFYLQKLEIETGKIVSKLFMNNPHPFISPDGSSECVELTSSPGTWIYNEWVSGQIWIIDLNIFDITLLISAEKEGFNVFRTRSLKPIPNTNRYLLNVSYGKNTSKSDSDTNFDKTQSGYYLLDIDKKELTKLKFPTQLFHLLPVSPTLCIGFDKNNTALHFYDLFSEKSIFVNKLNLPFPTKEKIPKLFFDQNSVFCVFDNSSNIYVSQYDLNSKEIENQFDFEGSLDKTHLVNNTFLTSLYGEKKISIVLPSYQRIPWELSKNNKQPSFPSIELFDHFLFTNKNQLIDLKDLEVVMTENIKSFNEFQLLKTQKSLLKINYNTYVLNDEDKEFWVEAYDAYNPDLLVWSSNRMKYDDSFLISSIEINKDESFALITFRFFNDYCPNVFVLDLKSRVLIKHKIQFKIMKPSVFDEDYFFVQESNQKITEDFWQGKELVPTFYQFKTGKQLSADEGKALNKNTSSYKINFQNVDFNGHTYYARDYLSDVKYLEDHNCLIASGTKLHFWRIGQATPYQSLQLDGGKINRFITNGNKLYAFASDGSIHIVDLTKNELLLTLKTVHQNGTSHLVAFTPSGYFKAPKQLMKDFHFVKNGKIYPLLNYEIFLNRPDIVLSQLDFTDSKTIELYKAAHLKRLNRSGFSEQTNFFDLVAPEVQIINKIPEIADKDTVHLTLSFNNGANTYSVYVNGVPTSTNNAVNSKMNQSVVSLHNGHNTISIVAKNKIGIESDPAFVKIYHESKPYEPKIHYIGVGVSHYLDTTWNLQYADDDVRSLVQFIKQPYYFKSEISVDTLVNRSATKENYLSLKQKLMNTHVNDIVLISFSGHGILDSDKNFYFATHDIDFDNPQEKGLSYDDILSLMDDIPARKKILLLDACHSGEADKENKRNWDVTSAKVDTKGTKGAGVVNAGNKDNLEEDSFELMKIVFQNLDRGNGTFVISASGAQEYAFENSGNGVFTASFINTISDWKIKNKGSMTISQLQSEVYKSVLKASEGRQKPTARAENIEWDWVLE
jgi:hypothetical protein